MDSDINFKPIESRSVRLKVVDQIVQLVQEGKLKPGDQLPSERTIAERMGISRPTVREAVAALEVVGLVETKIGQGTFIKSADVESLETRIENLFQTERSPFETLETRKILESHAAELAAQKASLQQLEEIEAAFRELWDEADQSQDWNEAADRRFHIAIAEASGNSVICDVLHILLDIGQKRVWAKLKEIGRLIPGSLDKDFLEHQAIFHAIRERDPDKARNTVWNHFTSVEKDIFDL
ncbi:MAG: FadR/GntR family transcriptional regulator [Anaerolineales bacterium]|jgi:GntR family transcriptional repressor for pyruvate dehydrogenase complex